MIDVNEIKRNNIRRLLKEFKIENAELARRINRSQQYINGILNANKGLSDHAIEKFAQAFGVNEAEFYRGIFDDEKGNKDDQPLIIQVNSESDKDFMNGMADNYRGIPLYESGRLAAGVNGVAFDPYESPVSMVVVYKPELKGCSKHNLAAIKVGGDSMEPTITKGSIVVVDISDKEHVDGKVYVVNTPDAGIDMASIKRVHQWESGFLLLSDNPNFPPIPTKLDWNRLCVGRVVWMWRDIRDV